MYQFIIPNKKQQIYFVFALGIVLLNIIGFTIYSFIGGDAKSISWPFAIICILAIAIAFYILPQQRRYRFAGTLIIVLGVFWISKNLYPLFFINLVLWLLYTISRRVLIVRMNTDGIQYPSFPPKYIPWNNVMNIVLKDDILTIDLKSNKIYQHVIEYIDNEVNEQAFNDYCKEQLKMHNP